MAEAAESAPDGAALRCRRLAEAVAAAGATTAAALGLRLDRVAVRVLQRLQEAFAEASPPASDLSVALTLSAPIHSPAATAAALARGLADLLATGRPGEGRSLVLAGSRAELRLVPAQAGRGRLAGLVHTRPAEAERLLELARRHLQDDQASLIGRERPHSA